MLQNQNKCIVIGAGLAGLASAVWLVEAGYHVTLLERRASLGGRCHAVNIPQVNGLADNGQHIMTRGYRHLLRYLESIGTRQYIEFKPIAARTAHPVKTDILEISLKSLFKVATGDFPGVPLLHRPKTVWAQSKLIYQSLFQSNNLDSISVDQWFRQLKIPSTARAAFWDVMTVGVLNEKPELASAKAFSDFIATSAKISLEDGWKATEFGYSMVDFDTLYVKGAKDLIDKSGGEIRTRAVVKEIKIAQGKVTGVELVDGPTINADMVVCAVPAWQIGGLLDQLPGCKKIYGAAKQLKPVPIVSTNLYLDRSLDTVSWCEALVDGKGYVEQVFDRQKMHGGSRDTSNGWLYCLTTSAAYELNELTNSEILDISMDTLRKYYPAAKGAKVLHANIVRMNKSTFSQRPGTAGIRPSQETSVKGLVLAGDWTQTDWPSTMEGAAQSAAKAVDILKLNS